MSSGSGHGERVLALGMNMNLDQQIQGHRVTSNCWALCEDRNSPSESCAMIDDLTYVTQYYLEEPGTSMKASSRSS
eukprot:14667884-Heterocapsa_arctica.AAC.1